MKSIRRGFVLLTLVSILIAVLVVGSISTMALIDNSVRYASALLNLTCENEAKDLNALIEGVEDSVGTEASYAEDRIESLKRFVEDDAYRAAYGNEMEALFSDIARNTEGAVSIYFHYDEALLGKVDGFRCLYNPNSGEFERAGSEEFARFVNSGAYTAAYFEAKRTGSPLWTDPAEDAALGIRTVSYNVPIFAEGTFVGVLGMELDFDIIVAQVRSIRVFDSGYAYLTDDLGRVLYHPSIEYGVSLIVGDTDNVPEVDRSLIAGTTEDAIITYSYQGAEKNQTIRTLQNGMRLSLSVDSNEVYASRNALVVLIVCVTAAIGAIVVVVSFFVTRRMFRPLTELTKAAQQVADGSLDVEILSSDTVEVKNLIDAYRKTVDDLKDQMATIDDLARHDGLTGLLNKLAYNERVSAIDAAIAAGEQPRFTVLMFDIDKLKGINDAYGHERGDVYIKRAVEAIGESFPGLPLYRIGGDEMVAIAEGEQADAVEAGVARLAESCAEDRASVGEPWRRAAVTCGYANFRPGEETSVAEVFVRADAAMYSHKHRD